MYKKVLDQAIPYLVQFRENRLKKKWEKKKKLIFERLKLAKWLQLTKGIKKIWTYELNNFMLIWIDLSITKYIRLKPKDYLLWVESLPYFQKRIAHKKNVEYRDFTVIPEK